MIRRMKEVFLIPRRLNRVSIRNEYEDSGHSQFSEDQTKNGCISFVMSEPTHFRLDMARIR